MPRCSHGTDGRVGSGERRRTSSCVSSALTTRTASDGSEPATAAWRTSHTSHTSRRRVRAGVGSVWPSTNQCAWVVPAATGDTPACGTPFGSRSFAPCSHLPRRREALDLVDEDTDERVAVLKDLADLGEHAEDHLARLGEPLGEERVRIHLDQVALPHRAVARVSSGGACLRCACCPPA
eukprot:5653962-Prymnesium_polylepis.1